MTPQWLKMLKPVWIAQHRLRRLTAGHFSLQPTSYSIYTLQSPEQRVRIRCFQAHGRLVESALTVRRFEETDSFGENWIAVPPTVGQTFPNAKPICSCGRTKNSFEVD